METRDKANRKVGWWLVGGCALVAGMVLIGGLTRLTESGLSIVDWKPLVGAIPPLTQEDWEKEFENYQQFPEYQKLNVGMSLSEFKKIYYMEYTHRLLGRALGIYFFFPLTYFAIRGYVRGKLALQLGGLFVLGGMQGALGWYMVKSGLDDKLIGEGVPRVSQYRLAAHFGSALLIYGSMLWTALNLLRSRPHFTPDLLYDPASIKKLTAVKRFAAICFGFSIITAISGAFVAGLDAGLISSTFPLMDGQLIPDNIWDKSRKPEIRNLFENETTVQFQHRVLAVTTYTAIVALYALSLKSRKHLPKSTLWSLHTLMSIASTQVGLGITTLLFFVPVPLAAAHQAGALGVFTSMIWLLHEFKRLRVLRAVI